MGFNGIFETAGRFMGYETNGISEICPLFSRKINILRYILILGISQFSGNAKWVCPKHGVYPPNRHFNRDNDDNPWEFRDFSIFW